MPKTSPKFLQALFESTQEAINLQSLYDRLCDHPVIGDGFAKNVNGSSFLFGFQMTEVLWTLVPDEQHIALNREMEVGLTPNDCGWWEVKSRLFDVSYEPLQELMGNERSIENCTEDMCLDLKKTYNTLLQDNRSWAAIASNLRRMSASRKAQHKQEVAVICKAYVDCYTEKIARSILEACNEAAKDGRFSCCLTFDDIPDFDKWLHSVQDAYKVSESYLVEHVEGVDDMSELTSKVMCDMNNRILDLFDFAELKHTSGKRSGEDHMHYVFSIRWE